MYGLITSNKVFNLFHEINMIAQFKEDYRWLSNFAPVQIILDGHTFGYVENAYVSRKKDSEAWRQFCSDPSTTPGKAKREGRLLKELRPDWDDIRVGTMVECLKQKYSQAPYYELLLQTGNKHIQEGNTWNDTFWGVNLDTNVGENLLGKAIMEIRKYLRSYGPYPIPKNLTQNNPSIQHISLDG